jgi:uncharacterized damage-inducible protein DinB
MNRRKAMQTVAVAAGAAATRPARASSGAAAVYAKRWNTAKEFTLKVAQAMPAEHYDFKPTAEQMSFGKLMTHLAIANTAYFSRITGQRPALKEPESADQETALKFMTQCFDWCAEVLAGLSDEDLAKSYPGRANQPAVTGRDLVLNGFIHTAHHRGYAEVYMRLKGVVPPRYGV